MSPQTTTRVMLWGGVAVAVLLASGLVLALLIGTWQTVLGLLSLTTVPITVLVLRAFLVDRIRQEQPREHDQR